MSKKPMKKSEQKKAKDMMVPGSLNELRSQFYKENFDLFCVLIGCIQDLYF